MSSRKFSLKEWNEQHFARVEAYIGDIERIFQKALAEAVRLAVDLRISPDDLFSFDDYPAGRERIEKILRDLAFELMVAITTAQQNQWLYANQKNDAMVAASLPAALTSPVVTGKYMARNLEALQAFQQRVVGGLRLSERVWKTTQQFRKEIELGLDLGIGEGRSAQLISKQLRGYLKEPEMLFRRVRSKRGNLVLSKHAQAYKPGQGVYRSSYKNAMRVARTEINDAYRQADHLRYLQLDFVVGIEVRRSNNPFACDICEPLKGKYPKNFKFIGWHPNCRCVAIPVLASREELSRLNAMLLRDEDPAAFRSENEITKINPGFTKWLEANQERLLRAKSLPQFVTDNV
ncbi:structural protein [Spirosoma validum]|uniref:Phage head morphogenesis domain-containing protein n=1 Tax=Spirosoma validum TaxID=2771355 RepID=A0A927GDQ6_9BACT|nr:hypothetical protein [Spirosoma validum]MBD2753805.1 hypothetical protein [Spirosoma validum]